MRAIPLAFAVLLLAGCGGGSSSPSSPGTSSTGAAAGATKVTATETEYRIQLSRTNLKPGATTFVVVNKGSVSHSLEIDGPGVEDEALPQEVAPGASATLAVTLRQGTYEIYCPVDGHKDLGMEVKVGVGGTAAPPEPTATTQSRGGGYGP